MTLMKKTQLDKLGHKDQQAVKLKHDKAKMNNYLQSPIPRKLPSGALVEPWLSKEQSEELKREVHWTLQTGFYQVKNLLVLLLREKLPKSHKFKKCQVKRM